MRRRSTSIERTLAKMSKEMDDLTASVAAEKSVDNSAIALIQGLSQQLQAAIASGNPAALEQLASDLNAQQAALASAVAANTPAPAPAPAAPGDGSAPAA